MVEKNKTPSFENVHWADHSAQRVIDKFPNEKVYTVASGITPSGYIHIGNFRELITSEMVRKALEEKGKKTKFIFSLDSYDAFRKVPSDIPKEYEKYLRMPDADLPSPFNKNKNFADEFLGIFEEDVKVFNMPIDFQKQHILQTSGIYSDSIRHVLKNRGKVIAILNKYRNEEKLLPSIWMPIDIYDDETKKDNNKIISYDEDFTLTYINENGKEKSVNFKKEPRVKLRWKADWPMRWNHFKVNFEPGGKDHSTPGSSYTVGSEIVRELFNREPPVYTMYDFIKIKGEGSKISSSKGGALRVIDLLQVYTPQIILFLFAGTRPNAEFDISFDMDVNKIYEDFDKLERLYYGLEEEKNSKKLATQKRIYELSIVNGREIQKEIPYQFSFKHLINIIQANDFNYKKVEEFFIREAGKKFSEFEILRLKERFECVKNWIEKYAPEDMKFSIQSEIKIELNEKQKNIIKDFRIFLKNNKDLKELISEFKRICSENNLEMRDFFTLMYKLILGKEKGPKLSSLLIENKNKILQLFEKI